jgi:pyridoxal phosphate enzyme (YggS family)
MNYEMAIQQRISIIKKRIHDACIKSGRNPDAVRLLLATKTIEPERIRMAIEAGETLVGENKIQEFIQKADALSDLNYERHFIGHLQTNKIKEALKYVHCIQSVDRLELAEKLHRRLQFEGKTINIFIQVNTSFEESKFGIDPKDAIGFAKKVSQLDTLKIKGFMTIGLFTDDKEKARPGFRLLKTIRDHVISEGIISPDAHELSMGMSSDLETAIEEGATIVRVGTAIFGQRVYATLLTGICT